MKIAKTDIVFFLLASVTGGICYARFGADPVIDGTVKAGILLLEILPQLVAGLLIGGLVTRLVSREKVARWLGGASGLTGLMLATIAGLLTPGGPFTSFPMVYALWIAGADAGALIAFISAWSLLGFNRLIVWELPLLGVEFSLIRYAACLPLPILAGVLARWLTRWPAFQLKSPEAE
ncbi:permease [Pseudooceanicola sp.]|uniref:permease n=1 Tax=Pseudooceanicola sp. TaxID=1914328 RepID=UPI00261F0652|nr:permease [Pseudooceanicola sp.]MDF1856333.1 permease [Pseudooceanicola sp.]